MGDTTVEVVADDAGDNASEVTQVEAVAQTAKDSGTAEHAAQSAQEAAAKVGWQAEAATESAQVSTQAALQAQTAAFTAEQSSSEVLTALRGLGEQISSLSQGLQSATPSPIAEVPPSNVVQVEESAPAKGHWLTRKIGKK